MLVSFISFIYFGIAKPLIHLVDGCNKKKMEKRGPLVQPKNPFILKTAVKIQQVWHQAPIHPSYNILGIRDTTQSSKNVYTKL